MDFAVVILVWACIILFIGTGIITIMGLLGYLVIGGTRSLHEYFLKKLFLTLVLAVVGSVVAVFGVYLNSQQKAIQTQIAGAKDTGFATLQELERRIRKLEEAVYK